MNSSKNFYRFQDQRVFIGAGNLDQKLTPGYYQMKYCRQSGEVYIEMTSAGSIDKTTITPQMAQIMGVVKSHAKNVKDGTFVKHSYKSKFGMLLNGSPGTGKSQCVSVCTDAFVKEGGIALFTTDTNVYMGGQAGNFLKKLNQIQPDLPILMILEDLDSVPPHLEVFLTSILDGEQSPKNTFFLGTTNFLEAISDRLRRPGRFDIVYTVEGLSPELRRSYIEDKLKEFGKDSSENNVNKLFTLTDNFNFSEIRTYMAYYCFFGFEPKSLADKITRLSTQTQPDEMPDSDDLYYHGGEEEY